MELGWRGRTGASCAVQKVLLSQGLWFDPFWRWTLRNEGEIESSGALASLDLTASRKRNSDNQQGKKKKKTLKYDKK